jgi:hypothetical protein
LRKNFGIILARSGDLVVVAIQFEAALTVRKQAGTALKSD